MARTWTASRVQHLRSRLGESQKAFAGRLGVDVETVRKWEQAKGDPGGCCQKLLDRLEEDVDRLFPLSGRPGR